jgi:hypothetical protein
MFILCHTINVLLLHFSLSVSLVWLFCQTTVLSGPQETGLAIFVNRFSAIVNINRNWPFTIVFAIGFSSHGISAPANGDKRLKGLFYNAYFIGKIRRSKSQV